MVATILALALLAPLPAAPAAAGPGAPPVLEGSLALGRWKATDDPRDASASTALALSAGVAWPRLALELTTGSYGPSRRELSGSECGTCLPSHEMRMVPLELGLRAYFQEAGQVRPYVTGALGAQWWREEGRPALGARASKVTSVISAGVGLELLSEEAFALRLGLKAHLTANPYENDSWTSWELTLGMALRSRRLVAAPPTSAPTPTSTPTSTPTPTPTATPTATPISPPTPTPEPAPAAGPAPAPSIAWPAWTERLSLGAGLGKQWLFEAGRDYGDFPAATAFELRGGYRATPHLAAELTLGWFESTSEGTVGCPDCALSVHVTQVLVGGRAILPAGPLELSLAAAVGGVGLRNEDQFSAASGSTWGLAVRPAVGVLWRAAPALGVGVEGGWLWTVVEGVGPLTIQGASVRAVVEWSPWRGSPEARPDAAR